MTNKYQLVNFEGQVRWATIPPRAPRGPHKDYTDDTNRDNLDYSIEVECSEEKFKQLKKAGIPRLTELREDEETGKTFLRIKAPLYKTNPKEPGNPWKYQEVQTYGVDGNVLDASVGNGSEAVVVALLKDNPRGGKILRLKSVRVTKLIPFEGSGVSQEEKEMLGLSGGGTETNTNVNDMF